LVKAESLENKENP
jgi:hypothetical protein